MREYDKTPNFWLREQGQKFLPDDWEWVDPVIGRLAGTLWMATEKLDGTGMRVGFDSAGDFFVRGRTAKSQLPSALLQHCFDLEERLRVVFEDGARDVCVYGEGVGKGIQKTGPLYGSAQFFVIFDINIGGWWLTRSSINEIADRARVPFAPVVADPISLFEAVAMWRKEPQPSHFYDGPCEGWVLRPIDNLLRRDRTPIRVKIKERDFRR